MPIYRLGDRVPAIDPDAYVHPDAVVIGDVRVGPEASIWPCAVLRGDYGTIFVGARTSVQDGTVVHAVTVFPTRIGADCLVGHAAHLEGCTVEDGALIASGSIVLHQALVRAEATVAANAVVTNAMEVPPGAMAAGVPATIREGASNPAAIRAGVEHYVANGRRFRQELVRLA